MQIAEMKALRTFLAHKHFRSTKSSASLSFHSPTHCPRHFHSTAHRKAISALDSTEADPGPNQTTRQNYHVSTVYDPVSGRHVTQRVQSNSSQSESGSGNHDEDSSWDCETERVYRNVKDADLSSEKGAHFGLSKFRDGGDGTSKENTEKFVAREDFVSSSGQQSGLRNVVVNKKKGKGKVVWVCDSCGHTTGQWWGICHSCDQPGTIKMMNVGFEGGESMTRGSDVSHNRPWLPQGIADTKPIKLNHVSRGMNHMQWRLPLSGPFGNEAARVLGGGLVPGSLVLVGGDPGVGKSTLLLQMAAIIAEGCDFGGPAAVVYVSGEESVEQISNRADRMNIESEELLLYSSTNIEDILEKVILFSPRALIIDSIQTVYLEGVAGSAGGISQVKECTAELLRFAKKTNIPVLLTGHVTKTGEIAGPRALEHIVDVVLYLEGEKYAAHRLLRSAKNRFGSTDELGVFEMTPRGLQAVLNPSEMFLSEPNSDSEILAGLAVAVIMDGSRTFLIEIQALCASGITVSRNVNGVQTGRADLIIAVLAKQAGLKIQGTAVFLNVVGGIALTETAGDLAIAAALCSSFLEFPIPYGMAFIGEIGLGGELRMVRRMDKRLATVAKLGYKECIVPKSAVRLMGSVDLGSMEIRGCENVKEVINTVFRKPGVLNLECKEEGGIGCRDGC